MQRKTRENDFSCWLVGVHCGCALAGSLGSLYFSAVSQPMHDQCWTMQCMTNVEQCNAWPMLNNVIWTKQCVAGLQCVLHHPTRIWVLSFSHCEYELHCKDGFLDIASTSDHIVCAFFWKERCINPDSKLLQNYYGKLGWTWQIHIDINHPF